MAKDKLVQTVQNQRRHTGSGRQTVTTDQQQVPVRNGVGIEGLLFLRDGMNHFHYSRRGALLLRGFWDLVLLSTVRELGTTGTILHASRHPSWRIALIAFGSTHEIVIVYEFRETCWTVLECENDFFVRSHNQHFVQFCIVRVNSLYCICESIQFSKCDASLSGNLISRVKYSILLL